MESPFAVFCYLFRQCYNLKITADGACELIRTRSILETAYIPLKLGNYIRCIHALRKNTYSLQVAVAAPDE